MKPADSVSPEEAFQVEILRPYFGNGRIGAVRAADRAADTKASLCKIEAVAADPAHSVGLHPVNERRIDAALEDEVLHELAHLVVRKGSEDRCPHPETSAESADHIIFSLLHHICILLPV